MNECCCWYYLEILNATQWYGERIVDTRFVNEWLFDRCVRFGWPGHQHTIRNDNNNRNDFDTNKFMSIRTIAWRKVGKRVNRWTNFISSLRRQRLRRRRCVSNYISCPQVLSHSIDSSSAASKAKEQQQKMFSESNYILFIISFATIWRTIDSSHSQPNFFGENCLFSPEILNRRQSNSFSAEDKLQQIWNQLLYGVRIFPIIFSCTEKKAEKIYWWAKMAKEKKDRRT